MRNIWVYILVSALVSYLIRVTPLVLIRREITNRTLRSFLYYVPYVTLAVMTFPAITEATQSPLAGLLALAAGGGHLLVLAEGQLYLGDAALKEMKPRAHQDLYQVCLAGNSVYGITPEGLTRSGL